MSDWRDVMEARREADEMARSVAETPHLPTAYIVGAILAVRLEIRALANMIDYVNVNGATNVRA